MINLNTSMLSPHALINIDTAKSIFRAKLSAREQSLYVRLAGDQIEEMKEFYDLYDVEGTGSISNAEIMEVMNSLGEYPT